jgi:hypothetical protein
MPTQVSKTQKLQKVAISERRRMGMRSEVEAVAKIMVRRRVCVISWCVETRRLKKREPSITEDMKQANIMPRGRGSELAV